MICKKCSRVKLHCEEEIIVIVDLNTMFALKDSHREHSCRGKVPETFTFAELVDKAIWEAIIV